MVSTCARRAQVLHAVGRGLSQRRVCQLMSVARSALGYVPRLDERDCPVIGTIRWLAAQYPRYGYRRIRIFRRREGHRLSTGEPGGSGRRPGCRCHVSGPVVVASQRDRVERAPVANAIWAYDFVFDTCANGQQLKCLTVIERAHARGAGDRCGEQHPLRARHRSPEPLDQRTRDTEGAALGQRPGIRLDAIARVSDR